MNNNHNIKNIIISIPKNIYRTEIFQDLTTIRLLNHHLTEFPKELHDLDHNLEMIDLSNNLLSELPKNISNFTKLKIAFFSNNLFTSIPETLANCNNLEMLSFRNNKISYIGDKFPEKIRWLILTNNIIEHLPDSIGNCWQLQKLMLSGNKLKILPDALINCKKLELLRISSNKINEFPTILFSLPLLSWLGCSGNPFNSEINNSDEVPQIDWNDLIISDKLGEGASGIIMEALYNSENIAVKIFKSEITSDGNPIDEMKISLMTNNLKHKNLIKILAQIKNHPENKSGLALTLIDNDFVNLGNPPDFNTCTKDTYAKNLFFTKTQILIIMKQLVDVCLCLHSNGIMHGDIYAHNILIDKNYNILLCDFGAASIYNKEFDSNKYLEIMDVHGVGYLLNDLIDRIVPDQMNDLSVAYLRKIKDRCINEKITFTDLLSLINNDNYQ